MTLMPTGAAFQAEPMTAAALSDLLVQLRDCLAGLLGTDGTPATALATLGALGGQVQALSGASTLTAAARGKTLLATGTWTLDLPAVGAAGAGWSVIVANTGSGTITLDGSGAETVDGALTVALAAGRAALLVCTGASWVTLVLPGTAGGPLWVPPGSAAAPGLSTPGDSNTGIHFPAPDQVALGTNGASRIVATNSGATITGLIDGTAVTQTETDSTGGRVMRVRAGGLLVDGATVSATDIADLNAHRISGFWRYSSGATGHPTGAATGGVFIHLGRSSSSIAAAQVQIAYDSSGRVLSRRLDGGTWTAWRETFTTETILGAVSQSGGVPTGRVIERGSNANGEYVRFADGTQICTHRVTANLAISSGFMGGFRSTGQTWTYPAAFAAAPAMNAYAEAATAFGVVAHNAPTTTTGQWAATAITSQSAADRTVSLIAIGRWF